MHEGHSENPMSLSYTAHSISYEEMLLNEKFLNSIGIPASLEDMKDMVKVLKTPNYRLLENYETFEEYGFFDIQKPSEFYPAAYSLSMVREKCDRFIELGLLNGEFMKDAPMEIVHSLAKWKRVKVSDLNLEPGFGINAVLINSDKTVDTAPNLPKIASKSSFRISSLASSKGSKWFCGRF